MIFLSKITFWTPGRNISRTASKKALYKNNIDRHFGWILFFHNYFGFCIDPHLLLVSVPNFNSISICTFSQISAGSEKHKILRKMNFSFLFFLSTIRRIYYKISLFQFRVVYHPSLFSGSMTLPCICEWTSTFRKLK